MSNLIGAAPHQVSTNSMLGKLAFMDVPATSGIQITPAGTTGNVTINKLVGTVNFPAGSPSSLVVTNNLVTTNSVIFTTVMSNDGTFKSPPAAVVSSGYFTLYSGTGITNETKVGFVVFPE